MSEKVRFGHISNNFCFVCFLWGFFIIGYNSVFISEDISNHAPLTWAFLTLFSLGGVNLTPPPNIFCYTNARTKKLCTHIL